MKAGTYSSNQTSVDKMIAVAIYAHPIKAYISDIYQFEVFN